jgi:hypothetical protein
MSNEDEFTWSRISLTFPEWKEDMSDKQYKMCFPRLPKFFEEKINLDLNDYGLEITLNQNVPKWAYKNEQKMLKKIYKDLSKKVLEDVSSEFKKSLSTIEGWRHLIAKYDKGDWIGNLQNHLDFVQEYNKVSLYDYYRFNLNSETKNNRPTDILQKIKKLPEDSLNEKWKEYYKLTEFIGEKNKIEGKTLAECISNADKIYMIAPILKELKF